METTKLTFMAREVYGRILYYPVCGHARLLTELAGGQTLTPKQLEVVRQLGFEVDVTAYQAVAP